MPLKCEHCRQLHILLVDLNAGIDTIYFKAKTEDFGNFTFYGELHSTKGTMQRNLITWDAQFFFPKEGIPQELP